MPLKTPPLFGLAPDKSEQHWSAPRLSNGLMLILLLVFGGSVFALMTLGFGSQDLDNQGILRAKAGQNSCILASPRILPIDTMPEREKDFACNEYDIPGDTQQLWLKINMDQDVLPIGSKVMEGGLAPFETLHLGSQTSDGEWHWRSLSRERVLIYWTAGRRYALPLTEAEGKSETLWIGVDRPWTRLLANDIEILSLDRARSENFTRSLWFVLFVGILLVPAMYSLVLFVGLRQKFMLWHAAITLGYVAYTLSGSGMIMHIWPDLSFWGLAHLSYSSLSISTGLAGCFMLSFLEKDVLPKWVHTLTLGASLLLLANAGFMVFLGPDMPFVARNIYHAAFLPTVAAFIISSVYAIRRNSRMIWFLLFGWALMIMVAIDRILRGLDIYTLQSEQDFVLYICLCFEVLVTACGVAYRMMAIQRERDLARAREQELGRLAVTDGLTGIANRRAFDMALPQHGRGALIIVDLDHFKRVNDKYGHHKGDELLRAIGARLQDIMSREQWCHSVYRLGGEEFALIVNVHEPAEAMVVADMVRLIFETYLWQDVEGLDKPATASFGVAMLDSSQADTTFNAADNALYRAKKAGRNRAEMGGIEVEKTKAAYRKDGSIFAAVTPRYSR